MKTRYNFTKAELRDMRRFALAVANKAVEMMVLNKAVRKTELERMVDDELRELQTWKAFGR